MESFYFARGALGDLRLALRTLGKTPAFTILSIALLTLGIGSSAILFSALNAVLLRPLPVDHPEQLVRVVQNYPKVGPVAALPNVFYRALRDHSTTLSAVFGEVVLDAVLGAPAPAEAILVGLANPEYFKALGVRALYGRTFDSEKESGTPPAVLSYGFWQRRFNGDVHALGQTVVLRGHPFVVAGVLPREFNGISVDTAPDVRVPIGALPLLSPYGDMPADLIQMEIVGRLKPGVTRLQAQAECLALWRAEAPVYFGAFPGMAKYQLNIGLEIDPVSTGISILRERYGPTLKAAGVLVGMLIAMVCASLAGLLWARGAAREEEIGVRLALGAGPARITRQILTEPLLLTATGASGGVLLAFFGAPLLTRLLPPIRDLATRRLTLTVDLRPDHRVLLFSVAIALLTALLFGLGPAIALARTRVDSILRRARSSSKQARRRRVVVGAQIALCTILLGTTALLIRTLNQLMHVDPGFDGDRVVSFTIDPSLSGYTPQQEQSLLRELSERIHMLPGVEAVGFASRGVMRGRGLGATVAPAGQKVDNTEFLNTSLNAVSPEYFRALGIRLLAGRDLTENDVLGSKPQRTVVNEAFVRRFFPNTSPVGQRFGRTNSRSDVAPEYEIVGVVSDARYRSLREPITPTFYTLFNMSSFVLYVRTHMASESVVEPVRQIIAGLDRSLPVIETETLREEVRASIAGERMTAALAFCFGGLAAVLAAVGLYALLAYVISQKRREIGIRIALGATPGNVGLLIGRESLITVACGMALGLGGLLLLAPPFAAGLLYGVPARDPVSIVAAMAVVGLISLFATAVPLVRAARIEPSAALRQD